MSRYNGIRCGVLLMVGCLTATACSDITKVSNDDITTTDQYSNAAGALVRRAGAIRDFGSAYVNQVMETGLLTDELSAASGPMSLTDARHVSVQTQASATSYPYPQLSAARLEALRAIQTLNTYLPQPRVQVGELYALVGFTEVMFAENMCSGVPLANLVNGVPAFGPTMTRQQLLGRALADFDSASANTADSGSGMGAIVTSLAAVGRGRALLDSGNVNAAVTAIANVPLDFAYNLTFNGQQYALNILGLYLANSVVSVSDREGENGLDFGTAGDPRVPIETLPNGGTFDNHADFAYTIDTSGAAPLVLASGVEARLMSAEGALRNNQIQSWADTLNALRSSFSDTALSNHPLTADSTTTASAALQLAVQFRERAFWLFLTGHRQGDLRRLVRQYSVPVDNAFPTGPYWNSTAPQYGNDVTFVPYLENGNPNFSGCLDRSP